jgi:hypothetical protein
MSCTVVRDTAREYEFLRIQSRGGRTAHIAHPVGRPDEVGDRPDRFPAGLQPGARLPQQISYRQVSAAGAWHRLSDAARAMCGRTLLSTEPRRDGSMCEDEDVGRSPRRLRVTEARAEWFNSRTGIKAFDGPEGRTVTARRASDLRLRGTIVLLRGTIALLRGTIALLRGTIALRRELRDRVFRGNPAKPRCVCARRATDLAERVHVSRSHVARRIGAARAFARRPPVTRCRAPSPVRAPVDDRPALCCQAITIACRRSRSRPRPVDVVRAHRWRASRSSGHRSRLPCTTGGWSSPVDRRRHGVSCRER